MKIIKNKSITSRDEDFAKWYTDIIKKAGLAEYSSVKGCVIIEPYAYAIWEQIQKILDKKFKQTGHSNLYMPLFIPESLLKKEAEHVEGFAPEVAWVTHGGNNQLEERMCIRPTSETLFCEYYSKVIKSYRDLPKLYNQWCNIVRWEKETRPFLRSREFLWQEGHTCHETSEEAEKETHNMLGVYKDFFENYLAIPVVCGYKTEKEKFAGAEYSLTVEALMYNGVSLQSGTSHYFGQKFSKPFNIQFLDRKNELQNVYQTSWGVTTRMIAALIMVHGDDNGLILPPQIAPIQVIIVTVKNSEKEISAANKLKILLESNGIRVDIDISDNSAGFKFAEHEMRGVPIRVEIGPRDAESNTVVVVRRDTGEKKSIQTDHALSDISNLLQVIQTDMFVRAEIRQKEKTYVCTTLDEVRQYVENKPGFIKAMWCGDVACENKMKEIKGLKSRCLPFNQENIHKNCVVCNKKAKYLVYWGIQY